MSRKQPQKPVILGPDGKPYVAPPKKAEPAKATGTTLSITNADGGETVISSIFGRTGSPSTRAKNAAANPLRAAVTEQVGALVEDFDGVGGAELPKPARDLHTYADAFASAREKCQHPDAENILYGREFFCPDCQRYFGLAEYKRTRTGFGRWFG